jgi:hypothetical protein
MESMNMGENEELWKGYTVDIINEPD